MPSPYGDLVLIANPQSGRGRIAEELPEVERQLIARKLGYRIVETEAPGHATALAREALEGGTRFLVAVGGDGTIQEVINGMLEDGRPVAGDAVLGVVAAGSGSDFVRTFGLPGDTVKAVRHLQGDRLYPIDVIRAEYRLDDEVVTRFVVNVAECGLGAAVVRRAARLPRWLGRSRYFWGFWLSLGPYRPSVVRVRVDRKEFEGTANNVVVANCQFYGGGMRISPRSYPGDGLLEVQISTGPKSEAFTLIPKIYRGEHVPHPHIKELRGREIEVDGERPLPVEGDGEVLGTTPARFTVLPEVVALKI
ncbi:MAG TPA: diacylglycerol kinase family protein [Actinomycetota bacterium]|nr:diacylglycerol kinase family protein [Actinomycetota bacterium]